MSEKKIKDLRINKGLTKQQLIDSTVITENELSFVTDDSVVDVPAPTEVGKVLTSTENGVEWAEGSGGDYLPLSGGTLTGPLTIDLGETAEQYDAVTALTFIHKRPSGDTYTRAIGLTLAGFSLNGAYFMESGDILPQTTYNTLGSYSYFWGQIFVKKINNGADIEVPTTGGTMALKEDIDAAVGNISTALTAILGE